MYNLEVKELNGKSVLERLEEVIEGCTGRLVEEIRDTPIALVEQAKKLAEDTSTKARLSRNMKLHQLESCLEFLNWLNQTELKTFESKFTLILEIYYLRHSEGYCNCKKGGETHGM